MSASHSRSDLWTYKDTRKERLSGTHAMDSTHFGIRQMTQLVGAYIWTNTQIWVCPRPKLLDTCGYLNSEWSRCLNSQAWDLGKTPLRFQIDKTIKPGGWIWTDVQILYIYIYIYIYMYIVHSSTMFMWCWLIASILDSDVMQRTSCCSNCHAADSVFDHEKSRGGCWMCHLYPFVSYEFGSVGFMAEINQAIALRTIKSFYCI